MPVQKSMGCVKREVMIVCGLDEVAWPERHGACSSEQSPRRRALKATGGFRNGGGGGGGQTAARGGGAPWLGSDTDGRRNGGVRPCGTFLAHRVGGYKGRGRRVLLQLILEPHAVR